LGTDEKSLNSLGRYLHCPNTVENPNDELHILQSQAEIIRSQLLVQVNDIHSWLMPEKIFEVFTA
jgi:hypothetical protein